MAITFTLKKVIEETNEELDHSKLLGNPVFPLDFLDKAGLDEGDYFIGQVDCASLPEHDLGPKEGYLYFFINVDNMKPTVLYTKEELGELVDDINDGFDEEFGETTCHQMKFGGGSKSFLFGEIDSDLDLGMYIDINGKVVLLQLDSLDIPADSKLFRFLSCVSNDGFLIFVIKKDELEKCDFSHVEVIDYHS